MGTRKGCPYKGLVDAYTVSHYDWIQRRLL
jgi:hypothetical protein